MLLGSAIQPASARVTEPASADPASSPVNGLPGFTRVKDGVATGRKPALDGFDSLKRQGYRKLVYLHAAGADTSALRDVTEKRGLVFVGVVTTPESLPTALESLNAAVANRSAGSVYVADDTGLRTGAVWYLHFRTVDLLSHEVARIRARVIGLTEEGDEAKAFWVAIQQYLATR